MSRFAAASQSLCRVTCVLFGSKTLMGLGDLRRRLITVHILGSVPVPTAHFVWFIAGLLLCVVSVSRAEQLPIKDYTSADGLVRDQVSRIVRDSFGFLWFCTSDGLSRFDGSSFANYTTDDGLPAHEINDLLETSPGVYWVATSKGLVRFSLTSRSAPIAPVLLLTAKPKFLTYYPDQNPLSSHVNVLLQDHRGSIWCGTNGGVFRVEQSAGQVSFRSVDLGMANKLPGNQVVVGMLESRRGDLWIATPGTGLYRYLIGGGVEQYTTKQGLPTNDTRTLVEDREGRLWVGTNRGLCLLVQHPKAGAGIVARVYGARDGLASENIFSLFQSVAGTLWVGSFGGLSELINPVSNSLTGATQNASAVAFRSYKKEQGIEDLGIWALAEDPDGNLWLGTNSSGAMKIASAGFSTFSEADGLGSNRIQSIFGNRDGELCIIGTSIRVGQEWTINQFDGKAFTSTRPNVPNGTYFGWGWNQIAVHDHKGEWWLPTGSGLYRFPKVGSITLLAHARPTIYTTKDELPLNEIFRLYEDSRGDIWIATISPAANALTRWDRASETFHTFAEADFPKSYLPTAFAEDTAGNLWIGCNVAVLGRYTEGRLKLFKQTEGVPAGSIRAIFLDHLGRLWLAAGQGLTRVDDPLAAQPHFHTMTTADGLSSNSVWCVTEDTWGHIYLGTSRGLDRLDPVTGHIRHYTSRDGLARGEVEEAFRDRHGVLWFGTVLGLSRLVPEPDRPQVPPPILITALRVGGSARSVADSADRITLGPSENQLQFDFVGIGFGVGGGLRYQYQLEGADRNWSTPTDLRTVNFANLRSGSYRFLVRAVTTDGVFSTTPAFVTFTILPPFWQRWWFLLLLVLTVGLGTYGLYRYRLARLLELERVRTRIATDLHDDIGSNLSVVAGLSEVVRQRMGPVDETIAAQLSVIAAVSQRSMDAMSDIVWAVNPQKDHLRDLVQRMRRFSSDAFSARNIQLLFEAPDSDQNIRLGAETRRQVFLIFKESVNNAARHSGCAQARVNVTVTNDTLGFSVSDNGTGFDGDRVAAGEGLLSMQQRARKIGSELIINSIAGTGTSVQLKAPRVEKPL